MPVGSVLHLGLNPDKVEKSQLVSPGTPWSNVLSVSLGKWVSSSAGETSSSLVYCREQFFGL